MSEWMGNGEVEEVPKIGVRLKYASRNATIFHRIYTALRLSSVAPHSTSSADQIPVNSVIYDYSERTPVAADFAFQELSVYTFPSPVSLACILNTCTKQANAL